MTSKNSYSSNRREDSYMVTIEGEDSHIIVGNLLGHLVHISEPRSKVLYIKTKRPINMNKHDITKPNTLIHRKHFF